MPQLILEVIGGLEAELLPQFVTNLDGLPSYPKSFRRYSASVCKSRTNLLVRLSCRVAPLLVEYK